MRANKIQRKAKIVLSLDAKLEVQVVALALSRLNSNQSIVLFRVAFQLLKATLANSVTKVVIVESRPSVVLRSLLFSLVVFGATANAQVWDARRLLAVQGSVGTVSLRAQDKEVAQVDRARIARFVDVVDKIDGRYGFSPEVVIVPGRVPNAFATRTKQGKPVVGVNPAMLDLAADEPDMTAVVVGHELAHLQLKHVDEGRARENAVNAIALIAGAALGYNVARRGGDGAAVVGLAGLGGLLINRKFDRDQEREADEVGIRAMHEAGFDVHAAPRLWTAMKRYGSGGSGVWTSTHPSNDERIAAVTHLAFAIRPSSAEPATKIATAAPPATEASAVASSELIVDALSLSGDGKWCLIWRQSADCRFGDSDSCRTHGSDCRPRADLSRDQSIAQVSVPREAQAPISEAAPKASQPPRSLETDPPSTDGLALKRLRELEYLRKEGLITRQEFERKRKEVLSTL